MHGGVRPALGGPSICSFRHPLCVHAARGENSEAQLGALAAAERAWDLATGPLALPAPDPSPATRVYDLYLVDAVPGDATTVMDERDVRSSFDRASAFSQVARHLTGCARDEAIAREIARAILHRVKPSTDPGTALAQSSYWAQLMVPCAAGRFTDVADFQARPDRALADVRPELDPAAGTAHARGASLFYGWLDDTFGARPGGIVRALWALSPTVSSARGPAGRWTNQPSSFDVIRATFKGALSTGSTIDDVFASFAAARASAGAFAQDGLLGETRAMGRPAEVRAEWDIPWPAAPRTLAPREGLAPTGSTYVVVRRAGAPAGARLRVEAVWEERARMRWMVLKRDAAGREIARIPIASPDRGTRAQGTIVDLDRADSLVVVGVNVGDFAAPFDPNDEIWEPHGYLLTLAAE